MTIITSKANSLVKKTKKLLQKKYRKESYLIEGWHLFEEARAHGAEILNVFVLPDYAFKADGLANVFIVSEDILKDLSASKTPQGIVAEIALPRPELPQNLLGKYLLLEDVQDPGNVGTMIRTADAAGFDAVFISDKTADIYNLKTLRSMQGSHFHLPVYRVKLSDVIELLKEAGTLTIATTLSENSLDYRTLDKVENFALIMGNEGQGISHEMAEQADILTHINMPGQAESLNVAIAAAVIIFSLI
ncbi:TrmH family RNA methyltransferase [Streptococcus caviae]|uniref:TrmH family RNA methyltransferase n=1 Tax=Streptococcus sp. 'caviae' TaxID=1915004 RepID=UPI00094BC11D|nr:RNA methyltransferase [Streptococcus sp. 'caviae']OLN83474.1 RNA methyltransferase [Streptococcus sp. 'caviae']